MLSYLAADGRDAWGPGKESRQTLKKDLSCIQRVNKNNKK